MDFFAVLEQLQSQVSVWTMFLAASLTLGSYYLLFRHRLASIFDPLGMVVLFSAFASAFLVILFLMEIVALANLLFVAATLVLLYLPLFLSRQRGRPAVRRWPPAGERSPGIPLLLLLLMFYVVLQSVTYLVFGIPLLRESRLTLFEEGEGGGILGRLKEGIELAIVVLAFIRLAASPRHRAVAWCLLAVVTVGSLLSGSKAGVLVIAFGWYLAAVYRHGSWRVPGLITGRRFTALVLLAMVPFAVTLVQGQAESRSLMGSVQAVAVRLIAEGDAYVYFLADNRVHDIARPDLLAFVRPILTALRLSPPESAVTPGFEVVRELFGDFQAGWGPNTRLPIFLLFFYGTAGLVFAPLLGTLLVFSRQATLRNTRRSPMRFAIVASLYAACARIEVDPQIAVSGIFNILLAAPLLYLASQLPSLERAAGRPGRRPGLAPALAVPAAG